MARKPKQPLAKFKKDSSVRLNKLGKYELKLTNLNRLFVTYDRQIAWPYLVGGTIEVRWDSSDDAFDSPPEKVTEAVRKVLLKQREIREKHALDFDEDEAVYTYSFTV